MLRSGPVVTARHVPRIPGVTPIPAKSAGIGGLLKTSPGAGATDITPRYPNNNQSQLVRELFIAGTGVEAQVQCSTHVQPGASVIGATS